MKVDKIINLDIENFNWNKKIRLFRQLRKSNYDLIIILTKNSLFIQKRIEKYTFLIFVVVNMCCPKLNEAWIIYDLDYAKQDNYPFIVNMKEMYLM